MKYGLRYRGICLTECIAVAAIFAITTAIIIPAAGSLNRGSMESDALGRIRRLSQAHSSYALDWNDQHVTYIKGDISAFGDTPSTAITNWTLWNQQQGGKPDEFDGYWHPSLKLGWGGVTGQCISTGEDQVFYRYFQEPGQAGNNALLQPIGLFTYFPYIGSANLPNARGLREYVGNKFYNRTFYSPLDTHGSDAIERPTPIPFPRAIPDCDFEYVDLPPGPTGDLPIFSSFALSPAAMFNPEVMPQSGIRDPWSFDEGFQSPNLSQCRYPSQKTEWLQMYPSYPDRFCSDSGKFTGRNRGPYSCYTSTHATHSYMSPVDTVVPAAFFDGSVLLSLNRQYTRDNSRVKHLQKNQGMAGLTHQPPRVYYYKETLGHHNFTVDGILGRDLLDRSPAPNIR